MLIIGVRNSDGDIFKKEIMDDLPEEELALIKDDESNYNCGGYALNTKTWFLPLITLRAIGDLLDNEEVELSEVQAIENELISEIISYAENADDCEAIFEDVYRYSDFANPIAMKIAKSRILKAVPTLREINSLDEITDKEYGIAYACNDNDFHFIKIEDNYISHKCGSCKTEEIYDSVENAFKELGYVSDIIYFANKY